MAKDLFASLDVEELDSHDSRDEFSIYVEQAEYIPQESFQQFTIDHPQESEIVRKLMSRRQASGWAAWLWQNHAHA